MPAADVTKTPVPSSVTTPPSVETGIGALEFTDGYPTPETATKLRDHLDYLHGVEAFMNSIQGVSTYAIREGFLGAGINDGDVPTTAAARARRHRDAVGQRQTGGRGPHRQNRPGRLLDRRHLRRRRRLGHTGLADLPTAVHLHRRPDEGHRRSQMIRTR